MVIWPCDNDYGISTPLSNDSLLFTFITGAETLNINKFWAKIKSDNAVSIKMFEKLGFREVG